MDADIKGVRHPGLRRNLQNPGGQPAKNEDEDGGRNDAAGFRAKKLIISVLFFY